MKQQFGRQANIESKMKLNYIVEEAKKMVDGIQRNQGES
jgi:hypothetical protein